MVALFLDGDLATHKSDKFPSKRTKNLSSSPISMERIPCYDQQTQVERDSPLSIKSLLALRFHWFRSGTFQGNLE